MFRSAPHNSLLIKGIVSARLLIAATLAALLLYLSASANAQNTFSISGTIYGDDEPLSNAALELRDSSQQIVGATTFSDPDGTYIFAGLEPGSYRLKITPTDRPDLPASLNNELLIVDEDLTSQDFYLVSGGSVVLSGVVKWPDGSVATGIDGIWVYLFKQDDEGYYPDIQNGISVNAGVVYDPNTMTNSAGGEYAASVIPGTYRAGVDINFPGGFFINGVPHASFYIGNRGGTFTNTGMWVPPAVLDIEPEFEVTSSRDAPDLYLPAYVLISGKIVNSAGDGVSGVQVSVRGCIENPAYVETSPNAASSTDCYNSFSEVGTQTDSDGNYQFAVPAGHDNWRIELIPSAGSGFTSTLLKYQDLSTTQSSLSLGITPLEPMPIISGQVKWPDGSVATGINGIWVYLFKQDDEGYYPDIQNGISVNAGVVYDPNTMTNSAGGEYAASVIPGTYRAGVDINFPGGFFINGVPHASFYIGNRGGTFTNTGMWVPPAVLDIEPEFEVTSSRDAPDLYLPAYVLISGKIVNSAGDGVSGVQVSVRGCIENPAYVETSPNAASSTDCYNSFSEVGTQTDSDGNYQFAVPAGHDNWRIELIPSAGSGFTSTLLKYQDLSTTQSSLSLGITPLEPMPIISGQVKWPDGSVATGINGIWVYLFKQDDEGYYPDIQNGISVNAGVVYDPNTMTNSAGGEYAASVIPGTYRAGVDINFPGGFFINGVPHASFYIGNRGGTFTNTGMWVPPAVLDIEPEFEVTSSRDAPDLYLPAYIKISGRVADANGVGVSRVGISVRGCIENPAYVETNPNAASSTDCYNSFSEVGTQTDSDGNYQFAVPAGHDNWRIELIPPAGSGFTSTTLKRIDLSAASNKVFVMGLVDAQAPFFVSGPTLKRVSDQTAVIAWQSSEPATSVVSGSGLPAVENSELKVNHEVTLSGLTAGASYSADIAITDRVLNGPTTESLEFTTLLEPDTTPPVITSGPTLKSITDRSVIVNWSTNEPALTVVNWGTATLSNRAQLDGIARTDHQIALTGLAPLFDYHVQVSATDLENNGPTLSTVESFRTLSEPDTTPPGIISGPFVTNISDTEATISWITDEPAVNGVSLNDGTQHFVYRDENFVTEHEVRVTGLNASTIYYYTVSSTDEVGNGPTLSAEDFFETQSGEDLTPPEIIEGLKIVGITHQSAVLHWGTDEPAYAVVLYGKSLASMTSTAGDIKLTLDHVIQLTDLEPDTTYYLLSISIDSAGNTTSTNASSFTTLSLPEVAGPAFTGPPTLLGTGETSAALQWETDQAAECFVEYGASGDAELLRIDNAGFYTDHQVVLNSLASNQTYGYLVECRNSSGLATTYVAENQSPAARSGGSAVSGQIRLEQVTRAPAQITNATIVQRSSDRMVLVVETNQPTTVEARYGTSAVGSQQSATSKRYQRDHVLVLTNLSPSTAYSISIKSRDLSGDLALSNLADEMTSSARDMTPPQIVGSLSVTASGPDQISVSLTGSEYAVSEAACIDQNNGGRWTAGSEQLRTRHRLLVKGLAKKTSYRCTITQIDTSGNKRTTDSQQVTLTGTAPSGAPTQPVISNFEYGVGFITLSFSVQSSGAAPLESFIASCTDGAETMTKVSTETTITFTGLDTTKTYRCSVSAANTDGLRSADSKLTPAITPEEPVLPGLPIWLLYEASKAK